MLAEAGDNVTGQHLATRGQLGYVVTDASEPAVRPGRRGAARLGALRVGPHLVTRQSRARVCQSHAIPTNGSTSGSHP